MTAPALWRGVVLSGTGGIWRVRAQDGSEHDVTLRGRLKQESRYDKLAVGDDVDIAVDAASGALSITFIHPRRTRLARRAPGGARGERIVVSNVDQVIIVFAIAKPEPHVRMIDRFLVIAEGNEIPARLVLNKADLVDDPARIDALAADYERAGYPVHRTSVKQPLGLDGLRAVLVNRTTALSGPSGVGKSSLINSLYPGLNLQVGDILGIGEQGTPHDRRRGARTAARRRICGGHAGAPRSGDVGAVLHRPRSLLSGVPPGAWRMPLPGLPSPVGARLRVAGGGHRGDDLGGAV